MTAPALGVGVGAGVVNGDVTVGTRRTRSEGGGGRGPNHGIHPVVVKVQHVLESWRRKMTGMGIVWWCESG